MTRRELLALLAAATVLPAGCGSEGTPEIAFDHDSCEHWCRMTISDRRHAAVADARPVDAWRASTAIECLAAWVTKATEAPKALWVTDAMAPGTLVALGTVRFHRGAPGSSPMGMGFIAVGMDRGTTPWDGPVLTWSDVTTAVATEGFGGGGGHAGH
jgi:hypothetical protein